MNLELKILQEDPFEVLTSTKRVVKILRLLKIKKDHLDALSQIIKNKLEQGLDAAEMGVISLGNFEDDVQLAFLEDVVNFCFWAEKDKPKWQVAWPEGSAPAGGWFSLVKCFERALEKKQPILDAEYLASLEMEDIKEIFKGEGEIEIPLLEKRRENLREAGKVLSKKFAGKFINVLDKADGDAVKIVKLIGENFNSFKDQAVLDKKEVYFWKRAQICAQDLSLLTKKYKNKVIKNLHLLTAFADYKLPQMLRKHGLIEYEKELAEEIDNYVLIPSGSREEIEIRSATIWGIELIRQQLNGYTAANIDNALWLISQDQTDVKPYHRTYTTFY